MTTDQIHQLDLAMQNIIRRIAHGYSSGCIEQGEFFVKFNKVRESNVIDITITRRQYKRGKIQNSGS
jgi:hypothetical protein